MIILPLLKNIEISKFSNITKALTALVTVAILSSDLGVCYTDSEKVFYKNPLFQIIAVFCVAYEILENLSISVVILGIWLLIKYFKHLRPHLKAKKPKEKIKNLSL